MKCICHEHKSVCDCVPANESKPDVVILYVFWSLLIGILIILGAIFLSSTRAEASRGEPGHVIPYCCDGVNPRSGTSYRMVAMAFQYDRRSRVFETGTSNIGYLLQWPRLETTSEQLIRLSRQRLSVVMAEAEAVKVERANSRLSFEWQQNYRAFGMAFLFGGIMLVAVFSTSRPRS